MTVTVQVPATTSNFGPGFDCLGCALKIYNRVTVSTLSARSTSPRERVTPPHPMVAAAADAFFHATGGQSFPFRWKIAGDVPMSRGLGSSVSLRLGVIFALNVLAGKPLSRMRMFELCAALEGHPDNAAPATFGGFTVAGTAGAELPRFAVAPRLKFVLLVPAFEICTAEARALLPKMVSRLDAVASSARTSRITAAFAAARYEWLGGRDGVNLFADDAFHQTHRLPLIPFLPAVIQAGVAAGALGGFLSGSGSTIACLTLEKLPQVSAAMRAAVENANSSKSVERVLITSADNRGAQLVSA